MTDIKSKPFTIVELEAGRGGRQIDVGYLVYQGINIQLTHTEYAVATSLLRPGGLYPLYAGKVRFELWRQPQQARVNEIIDQSTLSNALTTLRQKIKKAGLGDELIIPLVTSGGVEQRTKRLRLWTKDEIKKLHDKMKKPGAGVVLILDERAQWHLYIDGREINPRGRAGISDVHRQIIVGATSNKGFLAANLEVTISDVSLQQALIDLRRVLEKEVGMTLTKRVGGNNITPTPIRLIKMPAKKSGSEPQS